VPCFVSADSKEVTGAFFVSVDSMGVSGFRIEKGTKGLGWNRVPPPRAFSVRVANKGVKGGMARKSGSERT
jgi:hypothetical protein